MPDLYSLLKQFNAIGGIAQTGQPGNKWLVQKSRADPEQKESKYEDVYLT